MQLVLQKVHGSENDFFLWDQLACEQQLAEAEIIRLAQALCSRKNGLLEGADGLLVVQKATSARALAKMRVINSDGSEASMCGNGLRTVARYLAETYHQGTAPFWVETMYADLRVQQAPSFAEKVPAYQVEISPVSFNPAQIPMKTTASEWMNQVIPELSSTLKFSVVSVPNPHLITFVESQVEVAAEFERIAKKVNQEQTLFADGINVSFVEVLAPNTLFVRTFERGVGFTNACGTAMCASSLMYTLLYQREFNQKITVKNPGGFVQTLVHQEAPMNYWMELIGNASVTALCEGPLNAAFAQDWSQLTITNTGEEQAYRDFLATVK